MNIIITTATLSNRTMPSVIVQTQWEIFLDNSWAIILIIQIIHLNRRVISHILMRYQQILRRFCRRNWTRWCLPEARPCLCSIFPNLFFWLRIFPVVEYKMLRALRRSRPLLKLNKKITKCTRGIQFSYNSKLYNNNISV